MCMHNLLTVTVKVLHVPTTVVVLVMGMFPSDDVVFEELSLASTIYTKKIHQ